MRTPTVLLITLELFLIGRRDFFKSLLLEREKN